VKEVTGKILGFYKLGEKHFGLPEGSLFEGVDVCADPEPSASTGTRCAR
jgi:hypothetical protein